MGIKIEKINKDLELRFTGIHRILVMKSSIVFSKENFLGIRRGNIPPVSSEGIRAPGIGIPGFLAYGRYRYGGKKYLCAYKGKESNTLMIELANHEYQGIIVSYSLIAKNKEEAYKKLSELLNF